MAFLASPVANPALQCALASTIHQHREAFSSVMKFLKDLIHSPRDSYLVCIQHHICMYVSSCNIFMCVCE